MLSFFLAAPVVPVPVLATDRVTHVGDPVVMVIAQDRYIAEDAAGLIVVEYDEEDPVVTLSAAKIGRDWGGERVWQYVEISVVAVSLKTNINNLTTTTRHEQNSPTYTT